jgi:acetyl esterase/lipase
VTSCAPPAAPSDATLIVRPNVVFASTAGEQQAMDVVAPSAGSGRPMVLLIHGGGWRHGLRNDDSLRFTARVLAGQGYVAATASYRLTLAGVQNRFPAGVSDARCAVRWLRQNAAAYGGDPNRIAVMGVSAGGHLASMLGTARDESRLDDGSCSLPGSVSPGVQAAVAYYAPSELVSCAALTICRLSATAFLGADPMANVSLARFASPMTYVDASDPPHLLVHGSSDGAVSVEQSRAFRTALLARGVATGYVEIPGLDHAFPILGASPSVIGSGAQLTETCTALAFLKAAIGS